MSKEFVTVEQRVSYGIGRQMGDQLSRQPFDGMEGDIVVQGLKDALEGADSPVSPTEMEAAFNEINQRMQAQAAAASESQNAAADGFMAENAERAEVTVTESGMHYEVITEGTGEMPSASSTVRTHYHGTLMDGTVFDSSYDRGEPAEFPVNGVISGWTEALQMMPVGSKWRLVLPPHLAYGEQGAGGAIGPNATLVFDVELLDIIA
ncbi:MAG: FKBP-type peptidyl-prolyl cis-trans isomerase [Pseudomonadales bacterium]